MSSARVTIEIKADSETLLKNSIQAKTAQLSSLKQQAEGNLALRLTLEEELQNQYTALHFILHNKKQYKDAYAHSSKSLIHFGHIDTILLNHSDIITQLAREAIDKNEMDDAKRWITIGLAHVKKIIDFNERLKPIGYVKKILFIADSLRIHYNEKTKADLLETATLYAKSFNPEKSNPEEDPFCESEAALLEFQGKLLNVLEMELQSEKAKEALDTFICISLSIPEQMTYKTLEELITLTGKYRNTTLAKLNSEDYQTYIHHHYKFLILLAEKVISEEKVKPSHKKFRTIVRDGLNHSIEFCLSEAKEEKQFGFTHAYRFIKGINTSYSESNDCEGLLTAYSAMAEFSQLEYYAAARTAVTILDLFELKLKENTEEQIETHYKKCKFILTTNCGAFSNESFLLILRAELEALYIEKIIRKKCKNIKYDESIQTLIKLLQALSEKPRLSTPIQGMTETIDLVDQARELVRLIEAITAIEDTIKNPELVDKKYELLLETQLNLFTTHHLLTKAGEKMAEPFYDYERMLSLRYFSEAQNLFYKKEHPAALQKIETAKKIGEQWKDNPYYYDLEAKISFAIDPKLAFPLLEKAMKMERNLNDKYAKQGLCDCATFAASYFRETNQKRFRELLQLAIKHCEDPKRKADLTKHLSESESKQSQAKEEKSDSVLNIEKKMQDIRDQIKKIRQTPKALKSVEKELENKLFDYYIAVADAYLKGNKFREAFQTSLESLIFSKNNLRLLEHHCDLVRIIAEASLSNKSDDIKFWIQNGIANSEKLINCGQAALGFRKKLSFLHIELMLQYTEKTKGEILDTIQSYKKADSERKPDSVMLENGNPIGEFFASLFALMQSELNQNKARAFLETFVYTNNFIILFLSVTDIDRLITLFNTFSDSILKELNNEDHKKFTKLRNKLLIIQADKLTSMEVESKDAHEKHLLDGFRYAMTHCSNEEAEEKRFGFFFVYHFISSIAEFYRASKNYEKFLTLLLITPQLAELEYYAALQTAGFILNLFAKKLLIDTDERLIAQYTHCKTVLKNCAAWHKEPLFMILLATFEAIYINKILTSKSNFTTPHQAIQDLINLLELCKSNGELSHSINSFSGRHTLDLAFQAGILCDLFHQLEMIKAKIDNPELTAAKNNLITPRQMDLFLEYAKEVTPGEKIAPPFMHYKGQLLTKLFSEIVDLHAKNDHQSALEKLALAKHYDENWKQSPVYYDLEAKITYSINPDAAYPLLQKAISPLLKRDLSKNRDKNDLTVSRLLAAEYIGKTNPDEALRLMRLALKNCAHPDIAELLKRDISTIESNKPRSESLIKKLNHFLKQHDYKTHLRDSWPFDFPLSVNQEGNVLYLNIKLLPIFKSFHTEDEMKLEQFEQAKQDRSLFRFVLPNKLRACKELEAYLTSELPSILGDLKNKIIQKNTHLSILVSKSKEALDSELLTEEKHFRELKKLLTPDELYKHLSHDNTANELSLFCLHAKKILSAEDCILLLKLAKFFQKINATLSIHGSFVPYLIATFLDLERPFQPNDVDLFAQLNTPNIPANLMAEFGFKYSNGNHYFQQFSWQGKFKFDLTVGNCDYIKSKDLNGLTNQPIRIEANGFLCGKMQHLINYIKDKDLHFELPEEKDNISCLFARALAAKQKSKYKPNTHLTTMTEDIEWIKRYFEKLIQRDPRAAFLEVVTLVKRELHTEPNAKNIIASYLDNLFYLNSSRSTDGSIIAKQSDEAAAIFRDEQYLAHIVKHINDIELSVFIGIKYFLIKANPKNYNFEPFNKAMLSNIPLDPEFARLLRIAESILNTQNQPGSLLQSLSLVRQKSFDDAPQKAAAAVRGSVLRKL